MTMTTTAFVCTCLVIGITIYDVIAVQIGGIDASVSRWMGSWSRIPGVMLGVGFLAGHFWGAMTPKDVPQPEFGILDWVRNLFRVW